MGTLIAILTAMQGIRSKEWVLYLFILITSSISANIVIALLNPTKYLLETDLVSINWEQNAKIIQSEKGTYVIVLLLSFGLSFAISLVSDKIFKPICYFFLNNLGLLNPDNHERIANAMYRIIRIDENRALIGLDVYSQVPVAFIRLYSVVALSLLFCEILLLASGHSVFYNFDPILSILICAFFLFRQSLFAYYMPTVANFLRIVIRKKREHRLRTWSDNNH